MTTRRFSNSMALFALLAGTALAQAPAQPPAEVVPAAQPPAATPATAQPKVTRPAAGQAQRRPINPERLKAFRDQLRRHIDERLTQTKRITQRLEEALQRLDAGDDVRELKDVIDAIPTFTRRGGTNPSVPGPGPGNPNANSQPNNPTTSPREREHAAPGMKPERPAAGLFGFDAEPVRPLSPEEIDDTVAHLREHNAEAADQLERLREEQPAVFRRVVEWLATRTGAIREARERGDRPMVKARWDEVRAMLDMFRIAKALEQHGTAADPAAKDQLQASMRDALGRQFDARMEVQALQIAALEKRTGEMRKNLETLREKRDEVIRDGAQRAATIGSGQRRSGGGAGANERRSEQRPAPER